jgi:AcrR family transcriptional regulator
METETVKPDGRRELGERTCQRLLDATLELLAQRGEDAITLRDITDAAHANVAAVSYHFGSKDALISHAIGVAIERVLDAQAAELEALGADSTPEGVARVMARPVIDALAGGGQRLALFRILVRATINPPHGCSPPQPCRERLSSQVARRRSQLLAALRSVLPDVDDAQLAFRIDCLIGMLDWLALCPGAPAVEHRTRAELEELLMPMLVGALTPSPAVAPRVAHV